MVLTEGLLGQQVRLAPELAGQVRARYSSSSCCNANAVASFSHALAMSTLPLLSKAHTVARLVL